MNRFRQIHLFRSPLAKKLLVVFFAFSLVSVGEEQSYPLQVTQTVKSAEEKAASKAKADEKRAPKSAEKRRRGRPKGSRNFQEDRPIPTIRVSVAKPQTGSNRWT